MKNSCMGLLNILRYFLVVAVVAFGILAIIGSSGGGGGGGGGDDNGGGVEPQSYSASGTYVYDSNTGILTFTFVSSTFPDCGPRVGVETVQVDSITETIMIWDGGDMTWTRGSGTSDDITGTWNYTDDDGNSYNATIESNGTMSVTGEIVECGSGGGDSGDGGNGGNGGGGGGGDVGGSLTVTGESGNPVNLNGIWQGICDSDIEDGESDKAAITLLGSFLSYSLTFWDDSTTCSGTPDATHNWGGINNFR